MWLLSVHIVRSHRNIDLKLRVYKLHLSFKKFLAVFASLKYSFSSLLSLFGSVFSYIKVNLQVSVVSPFCGIYPSVSFLPVRLRENSCVLMVRVAEVVGMQVPPWVLTGLSRTFLSVGASAFCWWHSSCWARGIGFYPHCVPCWRVCCCWFMLSLWSGLGGIPAFLVVVLLEDLRWLPFGSGYFPFATALPLIS